MPAFFFTGNAIGRRMAGNRISIYGRNLSEWDQLASWIVNNDLYIENVVWLIQKLNDALTQVRLCS
ncbi:hypothetical protein ACS0TY_013629 [Phlomoides rotata]